MVENNDNKTLPATASRYRRLGFDSWVRKIPGGGHGNLPQYSCLENPMDRGAWRATVHAVAQNWTQLKRLSTHSLYSQFKRPRCEIR